MQSELKLSIKKKEFGENLIEIQNVFFAILDSKKTLV